jgi:hypothetical protein
MENPTGFRNLIIFFIFIFIIILVLSCSAYPEGQLRITKKYAGKVQYSYYTGKYTQVVTDKVAVKICDSINPDSVHCYIRTTPVYLDVHPQIKRQLERQYLVIGDKEYRIKTW